MTAGAIRRRAGPVVALLLCLGLAPGAAAAAEAAERAFEAGVEAAERGDNEEALRHYLRARRAGRESAALHHNMGSAYYRLGRYDEARAAFLRAAGYPRMAAVSYYNLGRVAEATGDADEARHWFRRARDVATSEALARRAAEKLGVEYRPDEDHSVYAEVFGGYDSNPRLASVDDLAGRDREGDLVAGGLVTGRRLLDGDWRDGSVLVGTAYADTHLDLDDQDLTLVEGGLGLNRRLGAWQTRYRATAQRLWLGGDGLLSGLRGEARAERPLGERYDLDLRLRVEQLSGDDGFDYLDGTRQALRTRLRGDHGLWRWRLAYTHERNDRDDLTDGNEFFSVSPVRDELALDLERYLFGPYTGELGVAWRDSRYPDNEERNNDVEAKREDRRVELTLGLSRPLPDLWTLRLEARYRDNDSNFDEFDYERTYVNVSLGKSF